MRILHITPALQHPTVRGPHRHFHFLRELSPRHAITGLTLIRGAVDAGALRDVGAHADGMFAYDVGHSAPLPGLDWADRLPGIGQRLARHLRVRGGLRQMRATYRRLVASGRYDVVLFHGKSVFPVIAGCRDVPVVVDFCDATSMRIRQRIAGAGPARRWLYAVRYAQVRRLERRLVALTPHRAFISPRDRAAVLGDADASPIVPNGVDLAYWRRSAPAWRGRPRLALTGVMDYQPNADAAVALVDRVLPRVRVHVPDAEVVIIGRDPAPALVARAREVPGVTVTGFVDDMRPLLEQSTVLVAPLRYASGTQNKLLEAMAMGLPVITTAVAAEGLRVDSAAPPVLVADDDAGTADAVVRVIRDAMLRDTLESAGPRFVADRFDWSRSAARLEAMCQTAVAEHAA
ncbi:hypothetical protein DCC79_01685 [bacterium]|nr:glycosyltransferase [Chloroflexi bacterium CFX6]RIL12367.1 MAG: hypothetical protein DCC79_01685 [bacterium]